MKGWHMYSEIQALKEKGFSIRRETSWKTDCLWTWIYGIVLLKNG